MKQVIRKQTQYIGLIILDSEAPDDLPCPFALAVETAARRAKLPVILATAKNNLATLTIHLLTRPDVVEIP